MLLLRTKRDNKFQDRAELGIMMGLYPQIPHGIVAITIQRNKTISEVYTAHVAPAYMEKSEKWFLKKDGKDPNKMVYVSTKGEVTWDIPVDSLPTVEEKNIGIAIQNLFRYNEQGMDGPGILRISVVFYRIIGILKSRVTKKGYHTWVILTFMHGNKFRQRVLHYFPRRMNKKFLLFLHN